MSDDAAASIEAIEPEPAGASEVFGERIGLAREYVVSLATDGVVRGLIGPREAGRLWTRHVLNSAVAAPLLPAGGRVVDIGSGAGLPGIPMAIARPDCRLVLVEPLERRAAYLVEVVAALGLSNVEVVRGRAENVVKQCGEADVVTSRAVAPLGKLAGWSVPLIRVGGQFLVLKGSSAAEEIERDRGVLDKLGLGDVEVVEVGTGVVDPVTYLIRGTLAQPAGKGRRASNQKPSQRQQRNSAARPSQPRPQR